jgi:hypothetical protein
MKKRTIVIILITGVISLSFAGAFSFYLAQYYQVAAFNIPSNSILILKPYKYNGTWVFDDARIGLHREAFIAGIPKMIDILVKDIPDANEGFSLLFSAKPFPDYQQKLTWRRAEGCGNWYYSQDYDLEGWLCPALFKYFRKAPKEIYIKAEPLH